MSFRPIKAIPLIGIDTKQAISLAKPPTFQWVDPLLLRVESDYQRDLTKRSITLIRHIAEHFNWLHIKPPVCAAHKNGNLCVIDGQHTAIAAASRGIKKIPVMIVEAEETTHRAAAFVAHNTNRLNITPIQLFHSRLAAGDEDVRAAVSICRASGVMPARAQPANGCWQVGETIAFSAIERLAKRRSKDDAVRVLKTLVSAKRAPVMAHEILAVEAALYDESFGYDESVFDLVTAIRSKSANDWVRRVKARGAHPKLWKAIAEAWIRKVRRNDA
ncbi:MAG: ParB N-terminal domain-containing protein [Acidobacteriaceae bacterium]